MTSLSYTIRGVFAGHLPRPDLGPDRHRTELFSRPRHLRRGGVQSRDERLLSRESGHAARSTEAARGDGPPGGLSAQTEDRKPNWVSHGNEKAFQRARRAIENADVGYAVPRGLHRHTGDHGAARL